MKPADVAIAEKEKKTSNVGDTTSTSASMVSSSDVALVEAATPMEAIEESTTAPQPSDPMDVEAPAPTNGATEKTALAVSPKKKKKKKASYKSMMTGMLEGSSLDLEKEKEKLRKVTGGGHFSKVDKI